MGLAVGACAGVGESGAASTAACCCLPVCCRHSLLLLSPYHVCSALHALPFLAAPAYLTSRWCGSLPQHAQSCCIVQGGAHVPLPPQPHHPNTPPSALPCYTYLPGCRAPPARDGAVSQPRDQAFHSQPYLNSIQSSFLTTAPCCLPGCRAPPPRGGAVPLLWAAQPMGSRGG